MSVSSRTEAQAERDTLPGALRVLRRRWPIILGVVLLSTAIVLAKHAKAPKTYKATSSVTFQNSTLPDAALQVNSGGSGEPQRDAATNVLIAHSPEVAEGVRKELGLSASADELLGEVSVEAAANADVLNIAATTGIPRESARLANAFAEQYLAFEKSSQLSSIAAAQGELQQQIAALPAGSAERTALQQSLQRLSQLRAAAGGSVQIIGRATPPGAPTGTTTTTTAVLGVLLGLAIAFSIVFLLESLDRRTKSIDEFEREYRLPALAGVPQSAFRAGRAAKRTDLLEPYRILRSALDFAAVTRQLDTLLVTSAVSGEGKTTVAVDLAHAVALTGRRVVLVELDLRRPTISAHFGLRQGAPGLTAALTEPARVRELLVEPFPELPNLSVLPSGLLPPNPSELLGSTNLVDTIAELISSDGIVIVDAPPLNPVADAQVLLNSSIIHATILVARVGKTTRDEVRRARAILDRHMVEPVGIVVTGLRDAGRYGYEPYATAAGAELSESVDMHAAPPADRSPAGRSQQRTSF
ncbi:MAG TPA: polysaccharide biosynthesis tyrosine autokinase [Solirubrobacteraceae bacterium]|nr:polysaccharide biosynthesis tyrosine autokinase [Solirubrobacteraceae bacterium]